MKHQVPRKKRLFLFAGYNKSCAVDDALAYYVKKLSKFGDIVLSMDCECSTSELKKIKPITKHAIATRHNEYDFGSYKRAYIWAKDNLDLSTYDYVYLVNDSVYGPLYPLERYFDAMENMGHDGFGIVKNPNPKHPHIQSWFIGLTPSIFTSDWFNGFMTSITKLPSKGAITREYEQGLSKQISENGFTWDCLYTVSGRGVYNRIKKLFVHGMPFMKKSAFNRNHGALGGQIKYILNHTAPDLKSVIIKSATDEYGVKYIKWLITKNPIKILLRNIRHALRKILVEGI
jgi:lipopolysaccharide biosynthesis protein